MADPALAAIAVRLSEADYYKIASTPGGDTRLNVQQASGLIVAMTQDRRLLAAVEPKDFLALLQWQINRPRPRPTLPSALPTLDDITL